MQLLHDRSHLEIIFQKAQSHISIVLFAAFKAYLGEVEHVQRAHVVVETRTDLPKDGSLTGW